MTYRRGIVGAGVLHCIFSRNIRPLPDRHACRRLSSDRRKKLVTGSGSTDVQSLALPDSPGQDYGDARASGQYVAACAIHVQGTLHEVFAPNASGRRTRKSLHWSGGGTVSRRSGTGSPGVFADRDGCRRVGRWASDRWYGVFCRKPYPLNNWRQCPKRAIPP